MTRKRFALVSAVSVAAAMVLAACGSPSAVLPKAPHESGASDASITVEHIHAATRDPKDGSLLLATHEGLFRQSGAELVHVGPNLDLMGFTIAPDGTYYASGHPGPGSSLRQPLGLISSIDRGASWSVLSRGGESDFHTLAAGPQRIIGHDGTLRVTSDKVTWTGKAIPSPPASLAAAPKSGRILATTEAGLLSSSDGAATWTTLKPPALTALIAFADEGTIVGITTEGRIITSTNAGRSWTTGGTVSGRVDSMSARRLPDGTIEVIVVVDTEVFSTSDAGKTMKRLL